MRERQASLESGVWLSVVAPAHNEQENAAALVDEIAQALRSPQGAAALRGRAWEVVVVDDHSTDKTRATLESLQRADRPWLRIVAMIGSPPAPGKGAGQSAAFWAGFRAAYGEVLATLDADLQNDPADLPRMLALLEEQGVDVVQGDRSHARRDNVVRRVGSIVGRLFRRMILGDRVRDTGCSLRVLRREVALGLPLEFRGMHRFIPATANRLGFRVIETRVNHRPRTAGQTKYGMGIVQRAIPGLLDCFAVRWMFARRRNTANTEVGAGADAARTLAGGEARSPTVTTARAPDPAGVSR